MIPVYIYFALFFSMLSFLAWWRITWKRRYEKHIEELLQMDSTNFAPWLRYKIECISSRRMMIRLKEHAQKEMEKFREEMKNW